MIRNSHFSVRATQIISIVALFVVGMAVAGIRAEAHAILKTSSPATGATVTGPNLELKLTFNVRVDAARSKLHLLKPDASTIELPLVKSATADTLGSKLTGLKPGAYTIRWQVLAPDGHISRGEIPFTVRNP
jgi:methionine-rich copper-binding protein CopC